MTTACGRRHSNAPLKLTAGRCAPQKVDPALIARFRPAMISCFAAIDLTTPPASYELGEAPSGQTIVKPTVLGPVANTDTKLLIYGLFQKGRVLAQDGVRGR